MKQHWLTVSTGFALFSMFFGSGNLVFPITVGLESQGHYLLAAFGILLTGVIVPFLGVLGIVLYRGDMESFFRSFGQKGIFLFSFLALALMGPFGVLARCLTVSHGALTLLFPQLSLPLCSLLLCGIIYLLSINTNRIIPLLGSILTPFLLLAIASIVYFALQQSDLPTTVTSDGLQALSNGFFQGYQTMDLLAAFFFSQFVIRQLSTRACPEKQFSLFCKASVVGIIALSIVYFVLVLLGSIYAPILAGVPPQEMLGLIAMHSLGKYAAPCVCLAIVFACLTTAIVLATLFAEFLRKNVCQEKISHSPALLITLAIGFGVSTLDFNGIASFLGPVLETVYPALIVLTLVNIVAQFLKLRTTHWPFTLTILAKLSVL